MLLKNPITDIRLDTGMRVLFFEDPGISLFTVHAWVSAGSANDMEGAAGCAHLLEHMAFCGTIDDPGSSMYSLNRIGSITNAFTLKEFTIYSITVPAEHSIKALNILMDTIFNPSLSAKAFAREKEVVLNEATQGELNIESRNINHMWAEAFQDSPYGRPVIGYLDDIRQMSHSDVLWFHSIYYAPCYVTLVIAGDFRIWDVLETIENYNIKRNFTDDVGKGMSLKSPHIKEESVLVEYQKELKKPYVSVGLVAKPVSANTYFILKCMEYAFSRMRPSPIKLYGGGLPISCANAQWQFMKNMSVYTVSTYIGQSELMSMKSAEKAIDLQMSYICPEDVDQITIATKNEHLMKNYRQRDFAYNAGLFNYLGCSGILTEYDRYLKYVNETSLKNLIQNGISGKMASITLPEG